MATPAYTALDAASPVVTQTRQVAIDKARTNDDALRDGIVNGTIPGWTMSQSGGTAENPSTRTWANGVERLRATYTYTGDAITSIVWDWSNESGSTWAPGSIATSGFTVDGSNNVTAATNTSFLLAWVNELFAKFKALRTAYNAHAAGTGSAVHGLGTISTQAANNVAITGGAIDNTPIGNTTRALGTFLQAREVHASTSFAAPTTTVPWNDRASTDITATGSGAVALAFSNLPASGIAASMVVRIVNGGLRSWTWPTGTRWAGGAAPTLTTSGTDVVVFFTADAGTNYYASVFGKAFS